MKDFDPKKNHTQQEWQRHDGVQKSIISTLQDENMNLKGKIAQVETAIRRLTAAQDLLNHGAFMAELGALRTKPTEDDTLELIRTAQEKRAQAGLLETVKTWLLVNR